MIIDDIKREIVGRIVQVENPFKVTEDLKTLHKDIFYCNINSLAQS